MTHTRLSALGALTGGAVLLWVSGAAAVTPQVTCVAPRPGGLTAYFGYSNPTPVPVAIVPGPLNRFTPAPSDRGQDSVFFPDTAPQPGFADDRTWISGSAVDFTGSLTWNLDGKTATATAASTPCRFDLAITASTDRATARPGEDVTWTVAIRNTGTTPVPRRPIVFVTDGMPPLASLGNPPDELLPGEVLVSKGITRPGRGDCGRLVTGIADVSIAAGQIETREATLTDNSTSAAFTVTCVTDLSVTASSDATTYSPGQNAVYTLTVANTGDGPVDPAGITLTDTALTGLAPTAPLPAQLAPGGSVTYRGTLAITEAMCTTGARNDARVTFAGDAVPANDTAFRAVTVAGGTCSDVPINGGGGVTAQRTTLALVTQGSTRVQVGGLATYKLTVRNRGRNPARNVVLQQFLPSGAALTQTPDGARLVSGRLVWRLGTLAPGDTRTVRVSVRFGAGVPGDRSGSAFAVAGNAPRVRTAFATQVVARPRPVDPQPPVAG